MNNSNPQNTQLHIRTSQDKWLEKAVGAYKDKVDFYILDDEGLGLSEKDVRSAVQLLSFMKKEKKLKLKEITTVLVGLGITGSGVWLVLAAIADPEPTSKLGLLVAGGIMLALTGSFGTLSALGVKFSVSAKGLGNEFHIRPEK